MSFTLTKTPDGDNVIGKLRSEQVILQPSVSDYPPGGYLIQGESNTTVGTGDVGLAKVGYAIPIGGEGGYKPTWNPATSKLQIFQDSGGSVGPMTEVPANTNLAAYAFNLLVVGY